MAHFPTALPWILAHEGGWVDDPDDPGGATNQGITLMTAQRHGIMTKEALRNIAPSQVASIYRSDYWRFDGVDDQLVATKVFDMAVNFGRKTAVRMVQAALNELGAYIIPDGLWGPETEAALNATEPRHLLMLLCRDCADRYRQIVANRPASAKFLKGWLRRADALPPEVEGA